MQVEIAMMCLQVGMLALFMAMSAVGARNEFERVLSPATWVAFFYTLWFLIPQVFALTPTHDVIRAEDVPPDQRLAMVLPTQACLVMYLALMMIGYFTAMGLFRDRRDRGPRPLPLRKTNWLYGGTAYLIGITCFAILGAQYRGMSEDTMRSALVKSTGGKALMTLSFLGSFAVAYLSSHLWIHRRRVLAVVLFIIYGGLVIQIGARGRIMWPGVFALVFVWARERRIPVVKVGLFGIGALALLSLMDPLLMGLRTDDWSRFQETLDPLEMFETLFYGNNFDGFANVMRLIDHNQIPQKWSMVFTGTRDVWMNEYWPDIYETGVAFPTTYFGEYYLSGGMAFVIAFTLLHGFFLGLLNIYLRSARNEAQIWLYLVLMPWVTSIGGEIAVSVGKMLAAMFPVLIWIAAGWLVRTQPHPFSSNRH